LTHTIPIGIFSHMRYSDYSKSERTRRLIIEKVAPVFNKKGYAATTLSDLTTITGLSKGSIYGNFKDKDDVALCAFEYNADFINKNLKVNIGSVDTCLEKLLAYPKTFRAIYKAVLINGGCPILNTATDADDLNMKLHAAALKKILTWKSTIINFIEKGIQQGEIKETTDAAKIAEIAIALTEGGYAMAKATREESYFLNAMAEMEQILLSLKR
jgi:TetR/AcrR family transcriptional regulator, transcriptional repressor for nem operon